VSETAASGKRPLRAGDSIGSFRAGPLQLSDFVRYAGASCDFNPLHFDPAIAKAAGTGGVFGPGILVAGMLSRLLSPGQGLHRLRSYRVRLLSRIWPGDEVVCRGLVVREYEADGERRLEFNLTARNQHDELLVDGWASVAAEPAE
jgi:acyl dehydratase